MSKIHFGIHPMKVTKQKNLRATRSGSILLMVIVVSAILFLGVITFSQLTLVESTSSRVNTRNAQSRALADSGTEYIKRFLMKPIEQQQEAGGNYSNPALFQGQIVLDGSSPRDRGRFSIVSTAVSSDGEISNIRYGVEDESTKLNLNTLTFAEKQSAGSGVTLLMTLPGMTTDVANAILDWIDEDTETREDGAESDFYTSLPKPYSCKDGPLETLDELLSVRGVTPELLYGRDMNRNGIIDTNEQSLPSLAESTGAAPEVDRGWSAYLTLYSVESNLKKDGTPRVNLNGDDLQTIHTDITSATNQKYANFIILYRQYGAAQSTSTSSGTGTTTGAGSSSGGSTQGQGTTSGGRGSSSGGRGSSTGGQGSNSTAQKTYKDAGEVPMDFTKPSKTKLTSVLDLIGAEIQITINSTGGGGATTSAAGSTSTPSGPSSNGAVIVQPGSRSSGSGGNSNSNTVYVKSPFTSEVGDMRQYLPLLGANMTTNAATSIPGRININQASKFILEGIPGMTPEVLEQIMAMRPENPNEIDEQYQYETWLLTEGACTVDQMKLILPFICGSGNAYRAQIVGYFDQDGPSSRVEMVINTSLGSPRIVFWRDMSHLGRGYAMSQLGAMGE